MSMKILVVGLFLLAVCPSIHSSAGHYPSGKSRPCCLEVTRRDLSRKVNGSVFYDLPARPPCVKAVIFHTADGPICVNPKFPWVKKVIDSFKKE